MNTIVTRFPPSPTGMMHIGTARTGLFNWLFARRHGGKMLFRIEDTDRKRYSEEAVDALRSAMEWLELDHDGEIVSQHANQARHVEVAQQLLAKGKAYKCYASPEELEEMRETAKAEGRAVFYDRRWRDSDVPPPEGVEPVIRIKAPLDGDVTVKDEVQGDVTVQAEQLDDFIILRSDGTPTYMLAVVVDDHDMGVTHVIRGDDHLNNTFRQNIIYDAMDWTPPTYAHIPLILGPDGAKMSKRHGAASVEEYKEMGYLPEAMRNYLLRLGWSHGDDEIISDAQAREWFDLEHIGKSPARFDFDKMESINGHYMQEADNARLLDLVTPFLPSAPNDQQKDWLLAGMDELKTRSKTLKAMAQDAAFYIAESITPEEGKAADLVAENKEILQTLHDKFSVLGDFTKDPIMEICKEVSGGKLGKVGMPLRAAITGTTSSPGIFDVVVILGKDETLRRLEQFI